MAIPDELLKRIGNFKDSDLEDAPEPAAPPPPSGGYRLPAPPAPLDGESLTTSDVLAHYAREAWLRLQTELGTWPPKPKKDEQAASEPPFMPPEAVPTEGDLAAMCRDALARFDHALEVCEESPPINNTTRTVLDAMDWTHRSVNASEALRDWHATVDPVRSQGEGCYLVWIGAPPIIARNVNPGLVLPYDLLRCETIPRPLAWVTLDTVAGFWMRLRAL